MMGIMDISQQHSLKTFLSRPVKEIFGNEYMGEVEERVVPELVFGVDEFVRI
jgi:hypothetical protein